MCIRDRGFNRRREVGTMRSSQAASAALAGMAMALLVSACGGGGGGSGASPGVTCSGQGHSVEVVVELGDHRVVDRCVGFKGTEITGQTTLHRSGIEFATEHFSFGDAVCQIDHDPKSYTDVYKRQGHPGTRRRGT